VAPTLGEGLHTDNAPATRLTVTLDAGRSVPLDAIDAKK
jgi:hypothetical protein